jgi:exodeoxyribonuclease V alpha subunit
MNNSEMNEQRQYSRFDCGFARFFSERSQLNGEQKSDFEALLLELSAQLASGHSCLHLSQDEQNLATSSGLVSNDALTPLIIDQNRLYTHRYWSYEQRLAKQLITISRQNFIIAYTDALLDRYFPLIGDEINWQKQAALSAITQGLTIITGGPGTGKTTTVVKILAVLQEIADHTLHIALAAPTGKAAMRLEESIVLNKAALPCRESIKQCIPEKVSTIHRLLGAKPPSPYFHHNPDNPLPHDLLVIDESSMVDLALMSKLVDAIKPGGRLILLGDKDQLASVESGAVLADVTLGMTDHTVELLKSHRFMGNIKQLADAVNRQDAESAWEILNSGAKDVFILKSDPLDYIVENYQNYLELMSKSADFSQIYTAFNRFKVLCCNQQGRNSVMDINARVEHELARLNKIHLTGQWYPGRPVIVTANNPALQIFNGDIGICLPDPDNRERLRVFFYRGDGSIKAIQPARLNSCQTVFAMTIHKSQGSEFERVLIMLPEKYNSVLSKELLYTAITRAKSQVAILAGQALFQAGIARKTQRDSGLADKLVKFKTEISQ